MENQWQLIDKHKYNEENLRDLFLDWQLVRFPHIFEVLKFRIDIMNSENWFLRERDGCIGTDGRYY